MSDTRETKFLPAFHRCSDNPATNMGIGAVRMLWTLRVGDDAITWEVFTGWGMPGDAFRAANPGCQHVGHKRGMPPLKPTGGAVNWHFADPTDIDAEGVPCDVIEGGRCYGDVGFLIGSDLFDLLCTEGDEAVWARLRELLTTYREPVASR